MSRIIKLQIGTTTYIVVKQGKINTIHKVLCLYGVKQIGKKTTIRASKKGQTPKLLTSMIIVITSFRKTYMSVRKQSSKETQVSKG